MYSEGTKYTVYTFTKETLFHTVKFKYTAYTFTFFIQLNGN